MKFTDGNWMLQPGVTAHYPVEAYDATVDGRSLVIHAPTRPVRHRGDTLQGPLLTIRISSPLEDVIRVRIEHFIGGVERGPRIPLATVAAPEVEIVNTDGAASLRSGQLTARIDRTNGWELVFSAGERELTRTASRGIGYIQYAGRGNFVHEQLNLGVGECVYGLGERFTAFVKNGQTIESWNKDGGTSSDQSYKSVPFYLTNRGYGVLVNETGLVSFEVATENVARVQFSIAAESLEYFLIHGPTPKDVLRKLTALTGRPALPPAWSFGLWLTTSFTTEYDEPTIMSFVDGMKSRDLPLHVFHFDCFWMREYDWCSLAWDDRKFPDPAGMLARLRERGLRVCLWINPYVSQRSALFGEARSRGFLLKKPNGDVWQTDQWQPGMAIFDFTNPAAAEWFKNHLRRLLAMGVDSFKTDFGERIPTEVVYHDGSDPVRMHNAYALLYNETVFNLLKEVRGAADAMVFARASHASGQRFPVHWGGDCNSTFESMAECLRGGLSLSLCGFGFWSHDIGGFEGVPSAALYKRWVAFGLLSSHSRLHGSSSYRVPWNYDTEACDVVRLFTRLKCQLMPYLYDKAIEATIEGVPMLRAMMLEFPNDPACEFLDRQYLLGDALLVAPVFSTEGRVDYYLPAGRWTHLLTGETREGARWHRERYGFLSLPIFVRPGTLLAVGARDDAPDYDYPQGITFRAYELGDGQTIVCTVPTAGGAVGVRLIARRAVNRIHLQAEGDGLSEWRFQLIGRSDALAAGSVRRILDPLGAIFQPPPRTRSLELSLPD